MKKSYHAGRLGIFTQYIKNKVKGLPFIYGVLRFILNPGFRFYLPRRNKFLRRLAGSGSIRILNIGSGCSKIYGKAINIDITPFNGVSAVSDAHKLAFKDREFDAVLLESVLEHVADPVIVVQESYRVLKDGGFIFVELPFMYEYHQSGADYTRYTLSGLEKLMGNFTKIESGIDIGPTGTLSAVIRNYFAVIFSFGVPALHELLNMIFGVLLFPFKFLDLALIHFKSAQNISSCFYFIGKKQ
ncbi:MAG: methyltransferase domain-containing protein [Candidatus Omnitrophica bacterium]|nr:methyltransferase domain-containing protein [Candidatus Omnitrophota bacterium]